LVRVVEQRGFAAARVSQHGSGQEHHRPGAVGGLRGRILFSETPGEHDDEFMLNSVAVGAQPVEEFGMRGDHRHECAVLTHREPERRQGGHRHPQRTPEPLAARGNGGLADGVLDEGVERFRRDLRLLNAEDGIFLGVEVVEKGASRNSGALGDRTDRRLGKSVPFREFGSCVVDAPQRLRPLAVPHPAHHCLH